MRKFYLFLAVSLISTVGCGVVNSKESVIPDIEVREIDLSGEWVFVAGEEDKTFPEEQFALNYDDSTWETITFPGDWDKQDVGLKDFDGDVLVRKEIQIPESWGGYDLELDLGKVDDASRCYLNGEFIGQTYHIEESNHFTIPSTAVQPGASNMLAVVVTDKTGGGGIYPGPIVLKPKFPWSEIKLNYQSPDYTYVYFEDSKRDYTLSIESPMKESFPGSLSVQVYDFKEETVFEKNIDSLTISKGNQYIEGEFPTLPLGHYEVVLTLKSGKTMLVEEQKTFVVFNDPVVFSSPEDSKFGLGGGAFFHIPIESHEANCDQSLRQIKKLGIVWGRNSVWWDELYVKRNQYKWDVLDSMLKYYEKNDMIPLGIMNSSCDLLNGRPPVTEHGLQVYAEYTKEMIKRCDGRIPVFEIWNEPNLNHFWLFKPDPVEYTNLLKTSYEAIKSVDPSIKVSGAVTSGIPLEYIEPILENGGADYMDIVSVHPYQSNVPGVNHWSRQLHKVSQLRELLDKYNPEIEIWLTECGWPTIGDFDEDDQTECLVKYFTRTLSEGIADKIYWFNSSDWGKRGSSTGGHWGLCYMDKTPKPSYLAMHVLIKQIGEVDDQGVWKEEDVEGHWFQTEGKKTYVVWYKEEGSTKVDLPEGTTKAISCYGQPLTITDGQLEIDRMPVYCLP